MNQLTKARQQLQALIHELNGIVGYRQGRAAHFQQARVGMLADAHTREAEALQEQVSAYKEALEVLTPRDYHVPLLLLTQYHRTLVQDVERLRAHAANCRQLSRNPEETGAHMALDRVGQRLEAEADQLEGDARGCAAALTLLSRLTTKAPTTEEG